MGTWVLVVFLYAGALASGDSLTVTTVEGFSSEQACRSEGPKLKSLVSGTKKAYSFECIQKR